MRKSVVLLTIFLVALVASTRADSDNMLDTPGFGDKPGAWGDPHFLGFLGQRFDFHGSLDKYFNLISDKEIQFNAKFVGGRDPNDGRIFLGEFGFRVNKDKVFIGCDYTKPASQQPAKVAWINDPANTIKPLTPVTVGKGGTITRTEKGSFILEVGGYEFVVKFAKAAESDCYLNFEASYENEGGDRPHGILGQTASPSVGEDGTVFRSGVGLYGKNIVQGTYTDYIIKDDDVFGTKFEYNKFQN